MRLFDGGVVFCSRAQRYRVSTTKPNPRESSFDSPLSLTHRTACRACTQTMRRGSTGRLPTTSLLQLPPLYSVVSALEVVVILAGPVQHKVAYHAFNGFIIHLQVIGFIVCNGHGLVPRSLFRTCSGRGLARRACHRALRTTFHFFLRLGPCYGRGLAPRTLLFPFFLNVCAQLFLSREISRVTNGISKFFYLARRAPIEGRRLRPPRCRHCTNGSRRSTL